MKGKGKQNEGSSSNSTNKKVVKKGKNGTVGLADKSRMHQKADEIDDLLQEVKGNVGNPLITKNQLLEINSALSHWLPPAALPKYSKMYPSIRIEENKHIQTTGTITNSVLKGLKWDIWKGTSLKSEHMILWEVCLVPVHSEWYRKDLLSLDMKKLDGLQGWTAKVLGNKKENATIVIRGWKWQRCEYLCENNLKEDSISWEFWKSNVGWIVNSKLEDKRIWVHIQWIFWYPYTAFISLDEKEEIESDENKFSLEDNKIKTKCIFCKNDGLITLPWDIKDWDNTFWIRCASSKNIITDIEDMRNQRHPNDEEWWLIFCLEHIKKGRTAIVDGDNSAFKEGSISTEDNNSQTDKENRQPIDFIVNKWDQDNKESAEKTDSIQSQKGIKRKKGKGNMQKKQLKKPSPKEKLSKIKPLENSNNNEALGLDEKYISDKELRRLNYEEIDSTSKVKTRNQNRTEWVEFPAIKINEEDINQEGINEDNKWEIEDNIQQQILSSNSFDHAADTQNRTEEDFENTIPQDLNSRKRKLNFGESGSDLLANEESLNTKINKILENLKQISEKVEMQKQFCMVLNVLFEKLNQDMSTFTSKEYWTKTDIVELKQWISDKLDNETDSKSLDKLKKRDAKETAKKNDETLSDNNQFPWNQSSQQSEMNQLLIQSTQGFLNQWKLFEKAKEDPEKVRYTVTPKLSQILGWPYISTNKMNEYPSKFINDELVKYFSKQGLVSNNLIDISKDAEFKSLKNKGLILTSQIMGTMEDIGLIERVIE